jgi:DNA-binding transcriptional LysR family regulator
VLSAAGRALYPQAKLLLEQAQRTETLMEDLKNGHRGLLRIGFLPSTAIRILPQLLRRFRDSAPDVALELRELHTEAQHRALLENQIDLGLLRDLGSVEELSQQLLSTESWCIALPESHPFLESDHVEVSNLAKESLIVLRRELAPGAYDRLLAQLRGLVPNHRIFMELGDSSAVFSAVYAGLGLGLVFSSLATIERPGIAFRPLTGIDAKSALHLAWRRGSEIEDPLLGKFIGLASDTAYLE